MLGSRDNPDATRVLLSGLKTLLETGRGLAEA